ncbi:MAG: flagellar brake protein [Gammaproteobacteria bacterium]|nr:flagellar brake protein [Gammaproteobacteria bacterium]
MTDQNELLNLTLGSVLQLQATVPENAPRYSVRLIGALPNASLVVTTPSLQGKLQIVREGQRFAVRALKGERVVGFVVPVIHVALKPYPHLHLEYPTQVEQIVVRNASRVSAAIPAEMRLVEREQGSDGFTQGTLIDLSETGAKVSTTQVLGERGALLHTRFQLTVSGQSEDLVLLGCIRNVSERVETGLDGEHAVFHSGVQFRSLSRFQQVLLHAWATDRFLEETLSSKGR